MSKLGVGEDGTGAVGRYVGGQFKALLALYLIIKLSILYLESIKKKKYSLKHNFV